MRYFGSKASTVERIYDLVAERVPSGTFCDPFGGIGIVGSYFKKKGYSVWCGDILTFAHYFQIARVERDRPLSFKRLRQALNLNSPTEVVDILKRELPKNSRFVKEYSEKRRFFKKENAGRIEACRLRIAQWSQSQWLTHSEHAVLLASLINSMDKVANTAGTYYAYLKSWYRKALRPFRFELLPYTHGNTACHSLLCEAKYTVSLRPFDVLYLDPPYNERCYAKYYHLPETIALGEIPKTHGKSGMPDTVKTTSNFNKPGKARRELEELLENTRFRLLAFHYSDNGLITPIEVRQILASYGKAEEYILDSNGYTTARSPRTVQHRLYLVHHG